jgi:phosphopantothenoylcysteine decarboxylase/phosphopantothenate--cysteine ligase
MTDVSRKLGELGRDRPVRIVLGVTGGIAAYKCPELVRRLIERNCDVQVVMTQGAREFVTPTTFQAVSGRPVRESLWDEAAEAAMGHIELARWADLIVIAPATAHCIGVLAGGLAGDLLSTLCLATTAPIILAPAMNQAMWAHPAVRANCERLTARSVRMVGPGVGAQACGDTGAGRMAEVGEIVDTVLALPVRGTLLKGIKTVITAGPTREPIDPVRYITNRSSGKMGFAVAAAAAAAGSEVVLVSGPVALPTPVGVHRIDVETAAQMYEAVQREVPSADIFIGCAAVSDYRPATVAAQKVKRTDEHMNLDLVRCQDTLASVAARPRAPFTVGFAAETHDVEGYAKQKLARKNVDMIAANQVGPGCGFDQETNALVVYWTDGERRLGEASKMVLAGRLIDLVAERYRAAAQVRVGTPTAV